MFPGFIYDGEASDLNDNEGESEDEFHFDNFVLEVSDIVENLGEVEQSKYVKLFEKEGEHSVGIYNTRIKALARRKSVVLTPIPANVKMFPQQVKSATKTFTMMTSFSNTGATNTRAGYCLLINLKHLNSGTKARILNVLGKEDILDLETPEDNEALSDEELLASKDFPNMYQSQTSDTLLHCTLCEFLSRSKTEFDTHKSLHPSCQKCMKQFASEDTLKTHITEKHPILKSKCNICDEELVESDLQKHMKEHEHFSNFRKGLESSKKTSKSKISEEKPIAAKKKSLNCYLLYSEEQRDKVKHDNPTLSAIAITKLISQMWQSLSVEEKNVYKEKAKELKANDAEKCPKCDETFETQLLVINHMMSLHVTGDTNNTPVVQPNQSTIMKCNQCGRMFYSKERLEEHVKDDHEGRQGSGDIDLQQDGSVACSGDCGGACNGVCEESRGAGPDHEDALPDHEDALPDNGNVLDDEEHALVWAKITSMFWPARIVRKLGELTEVQLFDEERTKKILQNTKLKP